MAIRTEHDLLVVESFRGVNQIVDELNLVPEFCPWAHGGFFNRESAFERLPGKMPSSATTGGLVLTLTQLTFADTDTVLIHQSSNWIVNDSVEELLVEQEETLLTPMEPFIF